MKMICKDSKKSQYLKTQRNRLRGEQKIQRVVCKKIVCDLELILPTELNGILRRFYAEVKTNKKKACRQAPWLL